MNTDFIVFDEVIRDKHFEQNVSQNKNNNFFNDSCNTINQYAREQNTFYNPMKNQILYGINSNMGVLGVSDGTCKQINPLIYSSNYKCGFGAAGGNRCFNNKLENFDNNNLSNGYKLTEIIIFVLLIIFLFGSLYIKIYDNF